jgi:hypothetical protein
VLSVVNSEFEILPRRRSQDIDKLIRDHNEQNLNHYLDNLQRQLTEEDDAQKELQAEYLSQQQQNRRDKVAEDPNTIIRGQVMGIQQAEQGPPVEYIWRAGREQHEHQARPTQPTQTDAQDEEGSNN